MEGISEEKPKKYVCVGILAHVDAGKTTVSEGILYTAGAIRSMGRVDNGDAFLDTYELERQRGITIFSKQAVFSLDNFQVTLLDTPGHVDFSAEMERTLQVLDYAVLVISGADGVQGHTLTLWRLLKIHRIPVFLFINKMDQPGTDRNRLLAQLQEQLDEACQPFDLLDGSKEETDAFYEGAAMCSEPLMEAYLETGILTDGQLREAVRERTLFPCYFGSALKMTGVETFLSGLNRFMEPPVYRSQFGARVFKIARDEQDNRLTYMKITGGSLKVRDTLYTSGEEQEGEKVSQIRIYSGSRYRTENAAAAGMVCAVTGLKNTEPGQGIGFEKTKNTPMLVPVLNYRVILPDTVDTAQFLPKLYQLQEEEPLLHVVWNETLAEIHVQVMGEVQIEILRHMIRERFGVEVSFGTGAVLYRETIADTVIGSGHFEPLRHYAEVHLRLEPLPPGSGLVVSSLCAEDVLAKNWQRLILTHLAERQHRGVLAGYPITDMKLTLLSGRAHLKHTEGGDFRQATYRAVRQGLMEAKSVLLEPWYEFRLAVPAECVGRAMTDLDQMQGEFSILQQENKAGMTLLTGKAPVTAIQDYHRQVVSYTKGRGQLSCSFYGYLPCHNEEEVIAAAGYDPEADVEQPTGSVFCAHGAGYYVPWDQVKAHCHMLPEEEKIRRDGQEKPFLSEKSSTGDSVWLSPEEIDRILEQASGSNQKKHIDSTKRWGQRFTASRESAGHRSSANDQNPGRAKPLPVKEKYLLVDGYNIIFAWEELNALAQENIDGARGRLMDILCNYQAFVDCRLMLVFDAYRVKGHQTEVTDYHNIQVVYTKEAETADRYIERFAHENSKKYDVTVATSDGLEQIIIRSQGCRLLSARDLWEELCHVNARIREEYLHQT